MANFCKYCGTRIDTDTRFCPNCGRPIPDTPSQTGGAAGGTYRPSPAREADSARRGRQAVQKGRGAGSNVLGVINILLAALMAAELAVIAFLQPGIFVDRPEAGPPLEPVIVQPGEDEGGSTEETAGGKEQISAHDYDWLYSDPNGWEGSEEDQEYSRKDHPEDEQEPKSPAISIRPAEGVTITAEENALDRERTFTMTEAEDKEYVSLQKTLEENIDPSAVILDAWELDAGLSDDEVLPGSFEMHFDLAVLDVDEDLYDTLCVYRVDDAGNWYQYASEQEGNELRISSCRNSTILIACVLMVPLLPDIATTLQGMVSGAVYDPRAKSIDVKIGNKKVFTILSELGDLTDRMQESSQDLLERARTRAREEAENQYLKILGYTEEDKWMVEFEGKEFYRTYLKCLKKQLGASNIPKAYQEQMAELKKDPENLMKTLGPVKMVIENSTRAYQYLVNETGAKWPDDVVRLELSDANLNAYGVTVNSYTFTRNPYTVLYVRKFADGSRLLSDCLLLTLVHELFHIVQREYKSPYTSNYKFDEVTAQVVEWEAFDYFSENGTVVNSKTDCLDNLELLEYFAIPLDKTSVDPYPDGTLKVDKAGAADLSYPIAPFVRYLREEMGYGWKTILTRYNSMNGWRSFTYILKRCFLLNDEQLTQYYLDFADSYRQEFYRRNRCDNPGFAPAADLKENRKVHVSLVNRDYVIRGRILKFKSWADQSEFAVVMKKSPGFDELMPDFRIIPTGYRDDVRWREYQDGLFIEPKAFRTNFQSCAYMLIEADGGTGAKTEGLISDTEVGYDLYMLTAPERPEWDIKNNRLTIQPMALRNPEMGEVVDSIVITLKVGETPVLTEQIMYDGWNEPWTCDLTALRIDGEPLSKEQTGQLNFTLQECVRGTYETGDPCLGPAGERIGFSYENDSGDITPFLGRWQQPFLVGVSDYCYILTEDTYRSFVWNREDEEISLDWTYEVVSYEVSGDKATIVVTRNGNEMVLEYTMIDKDHLQGKNVVLTRVPPGKEWGEQ